MQLKKTKVLHNNHAERLLSKLHFHYLLLHYYKLYIKKEAEDTFSLLNMYCYTTLMYSTCLLKYSLLLGSWVSIKVDTFNQVSILLLLGFKKCFSLFLKLSILFTGLNLVKFKAQWLKRK